MSRRLMVTTALAAAAGAALWALGLWLDPRRALFAYLTAYVYGVTVALGALALLMIAHASRARWFVALRPLAEDVAATLPVFVVLALPLALGVRRLYPWAEPRARLAPAFAASVAHRAAWLDVPFFVARGAFYLACWSVAAVLLRRWSLRADPAARARQRTLSAAGLPVLLFTATFAAFDWVMSLEARWWSTMFGVYLLTGSFLSGLALVTFVAYRARARGALPAEVSESHFHAAGRLLLAAVAFWAYIAFCQYLIIWLADIPEEATWYVRRARGGAGWTAVVLALGQFVLPFFVLLQRAVTRRPERLRWVAAWLLVMHYVDVAWLVLPSLGRGRGPHWVDAAALLAVAAMALAYGAWRAAPQPALAERDPEALAALRYQSS